METRLLTFELAEEKYAASVSEVSSILRLGTVTRVPNSEKSMLGLINLRSSIIPLLSLRRLFRHPEVESGKDARIVVVERQLEGAKKLQGMLVDRVLDVLNQEDTELVEGVSIPLSVDRDFFSFFFRWRNSTFAVLNLDRVMASCLD